MDLKEMRTNTRYWIDLTLDKDYWRALVNGPCECGIDPPDSISS